MASALPKGAWWRGGREMQHHMTEPELERDGSQIGFLVSHWPVG